jgi:hypothetical protein
MLPQHPLFFPARRLKAQPARIPATRPVESQTTPMAMPTDAELSYAVAMLQGRRGLRLGQPVLVMSAALDAWHARERVRAAGGSVDPRLSSAIERVARTGMPLSQAIAEASR